MVVNNNYLNSQSFKHKAAPVGKTSDYVNPEDGFVNNTKTVVPLKHLSNFGRSLAMPLINCKTHLEVSWSEDCILSGTGDSSKLKKINYMFL